MPKSITSATGPNPPDPAEFLEARISALRDLYAKKLKEIQRALSSDQISDFKRWRQTEILSEINIIVKDLNDATAVWSAAAAQDSYEAGLEHVSQTVKSYGIDGAINFGNRINTQSVAVMADLLASDFVSANNSIAQVARRYVRLTQQNVISERVINQEIANAVLGGETRRDTSNAILKRLRKNLGEGKLLNINGRYYDPAKYAELLARTRTREAVTQGILNSAAAFGMDLVQVSAHSHPDPDPCSPYQGKVFSISGTHPRFPQLTKRPPFHPNCKHVLTPVDEATLKERGQYDALVKFSNSKREVTSFKDYNDLLKG